MFNITQRYELMNDSGVNTEVQKANEATGKVCKRFRNLNLVDLSVISMPYHAGHGFQTKQVGK
jgi:hypothetical protein